MVDRRTILRAVTVLVAAVWLSGCTKFTVYRYPDFYQPGQIQSVTVVPFETSATHERWIGRAVADRLAAALAASGSYPIVRSPALAETPQPQGATPPGQAAVLAGEILHYEVLTTEHVQYVHDYPYYYGHPYYYRRGGHYRRGYGYPYYGYPYYGYPGYAYTTTQTNAFIVVAAELQLTDTGQVLHATLPAVSAQAICDDGSLRRGRSCQDLAIDRAVWQLLAEFAVTEHEIRVDPNKALRIVSSRDEKGEWRDEDSFSTDDTELTVAIALPYEAHRNTFDVSVVRKGTDQPLAAQTLTWDRGAPFGDMTLTFSPAAIAAAGGGPGKYVLRFYANGEEVMSRGFKIEESE